LDGLAQAKASEAPRWHYLIPIGLANESEDEPMKKDTSISSVEALSACTAIAVDLAKRVFQVAGEDAQGQLRYDKRIRSHRLS